MIEQAIYILFFVGIIALRFALIQGRRPDKTESRWG